MNLQTIAKQLERVQDCFQKVAEAQTDWNAYRRTAVEHGETPPERGEFVSLMHDLAVTATELDKRKQDALKAVYGADTPQAEVLSHDGRRKRTVVFSRPTGKIAEPHISWTAFHALRGMLGYPLETTAPFDIAVIDDFGRVSEHRIKTTGETK